MLSGLREGRNGSQNPNPGQSSDGSVCLDQARFFEGRREPRPTALRPTPNRSLKELEILIGSLPTIPTMNHSIRPTVSALPGDRRPSRSKARGWGL